MAMYRVTDADLECACVVAEVNPKKPGTKSYERYELYKTATRLGDVIILGGLRADISHDLEKGFITAEGVRQARPADDADYAAAAPPPPQSATKRRPNGMPAKAKVAVEDDDGDYVDSEDEADEADDGGFDEADCPCADFSSGPWAAAGAPAKRPAGRGGHTGLFGGPRARRRATRLFSTATRQGPRHTLVDTHSHVPPFRAGSAGSVLVSCHAAHWDGLASRALEGGNVALGVHPWWAGSVEDGWEASLREKLEAAPGALVGECGLDGLRGGGRGAVDAAQDVVFDGARQEAIFSAHVEIATSLKRPMTLHCVRAYGRIRECLAGRSTLPPAVALHAYGGSFEYARDFSTMLAKNGCATYFGVSAPRGNAEVPAKAATKRAALIAQLGDDSILLESDSHDSQAVDDLLDRAARTVAEAKGWTAAETARRCNANAIAFVGSGALRR
mmetsp:Transcript_11672/g.41193  ORF Transcript_11672/g.41193 Transcript_11672/m.41193 type:complete len:446 (-) Transcript_11672:65-1402(-)